MGIKLKGTTATPELELRNSPQLQTLIQLLSAKSSDSSVVNAIDGLKAALEKSPDHDEVTKAFEDFVATASNNKQTFDLSLITDEFKKFNNNVFDATSETKSDVIEVLKHFVNNAKPNSTLATAATPEQKTKAGAEAIIKIMESVKLDGNKVKSVEVKNPKEKEGGKREASDTIDVSNIQTPELNSLITKYFDKDSSSLSDGVSLDFLNDADEISDLLTSEEKIQQSIYDESVKAAKIAKDNGDNEKYNESLSTAKSASKTLEGIFSINKKTAEALENEKQGGAPVDKSLIKKWNKNANKSLAELDKAAGKTKSEFDVLKQGTKGFGESIQGFSDRLAEVTDSMNSASGGLSDTTNETTSYLGKMSGVVKNITNPIALLGAAAGLAGLAIKGFQDKLDIGRSFGAAGGGKNMVEQLRQMQVTTLIDPASLAKMSESLSKNFNVGLGSNQKEMTRVATKQRLAERVMGKEYADNQMGAINDMKTVLAGQSPSGMMDDLTAQTSALAKTMGVSNKYALEQIKAIHESTKQMTKGMAGSSVKGVESVLQSITAQNKAAGYTDEYNKETVEYLKNIATDKDAQSKAISNSITIDKMGGAGADYAKKALAAQKIGGAESKNIMQQVRIKGFDGVDDAMKAKFLKITEIYKKAGEFQKKSVQDTITSKTASAAEKAKATTQNMILNQNGIHGNTETSNKTAKDVLNAQNNSRKELDMNRKSANAAPAVDKLLVTLQQQSGNSKKSRQELEGMLSKKLMESATQDQKAKIEAAKERKIQFGMKKTGLSKSEYIDSLGTNNKEALITKGAKEKGMSRGDFLASLSKEEKAKLDSESKTMAQNQLNFDSVTTVMGPEITKAVTGMESGKKSTINGISSSELKAVTKSPEYERNRVKLNSNKVENAGDAAKEALIKANNAMERGVMSMVEKAIPYLDTAMTFLGDHMKEIGAILVATLGGTILFKIFSAFRALNASTGILTSIFDGLISLGRGLINLPGLLTRGVKGIFSILGDALLGVTKLFGRTLQGTLSLLGNGFKGIPDFLSHLKDIPKNVSELASRGKAAVGRGASSLGEGIKTVKNFPSSLGEGIKTVKSGAANKVGKGVELAKDTFSRFKSVFTEGGDTFGKKILNVTDKIGDGLLKTSSKVGKGVDVVDKISATRKATKISSKGASIATDGVEAVKGASKGAEILAEGAETASKATGLLGEGFGAVAKTFGKFLGPLGIAVTVAMAAKGAYDGWNDASKNLNLSMNASKKQALKYGAAVDKSGNLVRDSAGRILDSSGKVIEIAATNSQKFSSALGGAVESLSMGLISASASAQWFDSHFGTTWTKISAIWTSFVDGAKQLWADTKVIFGPLIEDVKKVFGDIGDIFSGSINFLVDLFTGNFGALKKDVTTLLSDIGTLFSDIPKLLEDGIVAAWRWLGNLGARLSLKLKSLWWDLEDAWDAFDVTKDLIEPLSNMITTGFNSFIKWITNIHPLDALIGMISDGLDSLGTAVTKHLPDFMLSKEQIAAKNKAKKQDEKDAKVKAVQSGAMGKELMSVLANNGLGDTDSSFNKYDKAHVTQEGANILSDKQIKSLIEASSGDNKTVNMGDASLKLLKEELKARKAGTKKQETVKDASGKAVKASDYSISGMETSGSMKKTKSGKMEITDFSKFATKTSQEISDYISANRKSLTKESRTKLISMASHQDTDQTKAAKADLAQRKKENATAKDTKLKGLHFSDDPAQDRAKVHTGALDSDNAKKRLEKDIPSNSKGFMDSLSGSFGTLMGDSNKIASDGFSNVVAAIKNQDLSAMPTTNNSYAVGKTAKKTEKALKADELSKTLQTKVDNGTASKEDAKALKVLKQQEKKPIATPPIKTPEHLADISTREKVKAQNLKERQANTNFTTTASKAMPSSLDIAALQKLHEKILTDGGKAAKDLVTKMGDTVEKGKKATEGNGTLAGAKAMDDYLKKRKELKEKNPKKTDKELDVSAWNAMLPNQKKLIIMEQKALKEKLNLRQNGISGNTEAQNKSTNSNATSNATATVKAVDKATKTTKISKVGSEMSNDLKKLIKSDKKGDVLKKLKEIGVDNYSQLSSMVNVAKENGKMTEGDQSILMKAKNIMDVSSGKKSQKQVDLEESKGKKLKTSANKFVVDKANGVWNENLTKTKDGNFLVQKDKLSKEMDSAKKIVDPKKRNAEMERVAKAQTNLAKNDDSDLAKEGRYLKEKEKLSKDLKKAKANKDPKKVKEIEARQKEMAESDIGKRDKAGKLKKDSKETKVIKSKIAIKTAISKGNFKDAKLKTKALFGDDLKKHQELTTKKLDGQIADEKLKFNEKKQKKATEESKTIVSPSVTIPSSMSNTIAVNNNGEYSSGNTIGKNLDVPKKTSVLDTYGPRVKNAKSTIPTVTNKAPVMGPVNQKYVPPKQTVMTQQSSGSIKTEGIDSTTSTSVELNKKMLAALDKNNQIQAELLKHASTTSAEAKAQTKQAAKTHQVVVNT